MTKLKLLILVLISSSCSNNENCNSEKLEIIEKYDYLIALASGDEQQQQNLIEEKQARLDNVECNN